MENLLEPVFARNRYGESKVIQALMSQDKSSIVVAVTFPSELKNFAAYKIFSVNGQFFHQFLHTCFEENGALVNCGTMHAGKRIINEGSCVICRTH